MTTLTDLTFTLAQINPHVGDIHGNCKRITDIILQNTAHSDIIIFPELVTSGYPPEDLILRPSFMDNLEKAVYQICDSVKDFKGLSLVSSPWRMKDENQDRLYNAVLVISGGKIIHVIPKVHLPNYDVFDEKRIFDKGKLPLPIDYKGVKLGILTCEDLWFEDVAQHLKTHGATVLISPNGSPYDINKQSTRFQIACTRVQALEIPLIYVNQVGGQDELVFDGGSFILGQNQDSLFQAPYFMEDISQFSFLNQPDTAHKPSSKPCHMDAKTATDKSDLESSSPRQGVTGVNPHQAYEHIYKALCLGLGDYVRKNGFKGILIGLSGGIDSAISAVIAADAIGAENVQCVMLPTKYTSQISLDDAAQLAENIGCAYDIIAIEDTVGAISSMIGEAATQGVTAENIQSRLRGLTLMALSNSSGKMVLSTGNKSEMAVGYATLYGDMCGGFNALKDIYKTEVFALCRYINEVAGYPRIPDRIITRPPSAELRADQTDQDSLPPYDILDAILHGIIEDHLSLQDLTDKGFDVETVKKIWRLLDRAEYKRKQAPPGVKITAKAFGRDRRYPMTNGYKEE